MSHGQAFWDQILGTAQNINATSYYELLGLDMSADADSIREAYYKLVRQLHPDRHARESTERKRALTVVYARLGEAYRILSAPATRQQYDQGLDQGKQRLVETARRGGGNVRDPKTAQGIQLLAAGKQLLAANDKRGARARWDLALQYEPNSKALQQALAELDALEAPVAQPEPAATPTPAATPAPAPRPAPRPEPAPALRPEPAPALRPEPGPEPAPAPASRPEPAQDMFSREDTRHPLARPVKIRCSTWDKVRVLYTRDISRGGMFLRTSKGMELGTALRLVLTLPDGQQLEIEAEVARVVTTKDAGKKGPGVGVRFLHLEPKRKHLEQILASLPKSKAKGEVTTEPPPSLRPPTQPPAVVLPLTEPVDPREIAVLQELRARLALMKQETPCGRLGVPDGSDQRAIRSAYLRLAKDYHPDLYRRYSATDIHATASEVFFMLRVTYQKLRNQGQAAAASKPASQPTSSSAATPATPATTRARAAAKPKPAPPPAPVIAPPAPVASVKRLSFDTPALRNLDDDGELSDTISRVSRPVFVQTNPGQQTLMPGLDDSFDDAFAALEMGTDDDQADIGRRALQNHEYTAARIALQKAVAAEPGNEQLRAQFHLAAGYEALSKGDEVNARQQFETVLIFDKHCAEAIEQVRGKERQ